jgi:formylglycine-generating enzyme required for sulfatase activity
VKNLDGTDDLPVENVSWEEAQAFLSKLSALAEEKKAGRRYRLPTEAEWEYGCRGGSSTYRTFHFGRSLSSARANFDGRFPYGGAEKGPYLKRTCKVGRHEPNGFGLYDVCGNVDEWCQDWYGENYYARSPNRDPLGPSEGSHRVLRGGCWNANGEHCRSADRDMALPGDRNKQLGFRVAAAWVD